MPLRFCEIDFSLAYQTVRLCYEETNYRLPHLKAFSSRVGTYDTVEIAGGIPLFFSSLDENEIGVG